MTRIVQAKAIKGSQKWLQVLVNEHQEILDDLLRPRLRLSSHENIHWLSPLHEDGYAEYRDQEFLELLNIQLKYRSLDSFWPHGGPVWDGLARTSRGDVILVEAKSHLSELASSCKAGEESLGLIRTSLADTAGFYQSTSSENWLEGYYQYANRLAHLYLLRELNGIPAWLLFAYFVNDFAMGGPESVRDWQSAIETVHRHLGLLSEEQVQGVIDVFIDTTMTFGIGTTEKEHVIQDALGTLEEYSIYVVKPQRSKGRKLCKGYPTTVKACNGKDALFQTLKRKL